MSTFLAVATGQLSEVFPKLNDRRDRAALSVLTSCFFNNSHCACSLNEVPAKSNQCYDVTGTDSQGRITCAARNCNPAHYCNCDGTQLCKLEDVSRVSIRRIESTNYCTRTMVKKTVATLLQGERVPNHSLSGPELAAFNQTHCSCSPKSNIVGGMTCLDFESTLVGGGSQCSTRPCTLNPDEMICDLDGNSLCERRIVTQNTFINDGPIPSSRGKVYCHMQATEVEHPACISSCPSHQSASNSILQTL